MYDKVNSWPITRIAPRLLLGLLLVAPAVQAARYPYGDGLVRFGHQQVDAAPVLQQESAPAATVAPGGSEEDYLQQIARLEAQAGPYANGLSESLNDLGRYYLAKGDAERALAVFSRGLHISRINNGLNSQAQVPLLRATLDTYRMSGDYKGLDDRYDYYFKLLGAGQPPYTELRMAAALGYLRWQREALRLKIDRSRERRLYNLLRLNNQLLDVVESNEELQARWFAQFALSQVKNLYLLQAMVEPRADTSESVLSPMGMPASRLDEDPLRSSLLRSRIAAFNAGTALMLEASARLPETAPVEDRARLQLALGDWYVWNDRESSAGRYYATAVELLSDAGRSDLLHQWLGEPVELPDNGVYFQPRFGEAIEEAQAISVRYEVSQSGRVANLALTAQPLPEQEGKARRILRKLRSVRFRPRWQSGFAEGAQVQRRYVWLDQARARAP